MSMAIRKERVVPRKDTLWHQVRINKASYLLMAPYFILFFLFTVLPVLMTETAILLTSVLFLEPV